MACQRSGPCLARARRLSCRRGCGTTAANSGERIDPVRVTVVGEAYGDHGGSTASAERTGGSDARIWCKQHRAQSRDNRPGKRLPPHPGPQPGTPAADRPHPGPQPRTPAADRPHPGPQPRTPAADRPHPGPQPRTTSPSGGCIEGEANRAGPTARAGSASCRLDAARRVSLPDKEEIAGLAAWTVRWLQELTGTQKAHTLRSYQRPDHAKHHR
jgi:hypothetical protein